MCTSVGAQERSTQVFRLVFKSLQSTWNKLYMYLEND